MLENKIEYEIILNMEAEFDNNIKDFSILINKFNNGLELYQKNALFANCIELLIRGGDVYKILEEIIVMQDNIQKKYEELIKSGFLRQEIIVSKERFDEIKFCNNLK